MSNATALKFGYPHTLVAESAHWWILARPRQVTLGSLVLVCKQPVTAFGDVSAAGFTDLQAVIARAESMLKGITAYERINYLMLMMVDPDVHFHVIPRYGTPREYAGVNLPDASWPNPLNLAAAIELAPDVLAALTADLKARWDTA
ncbi:MAG: HIT family protein [Pseudomonadota bacterium]